jgi:hypothetical protein
MLNRFIYSAALEGIHAASRSTIDRWSSTAWPERVGIRELQQDVSWTHALEGVSVSSNLVSVQLLRSIGIVTPFPEPLRFPSTIPRGLARARRRGAGHWACKRLRGIRQWRVSSCPHISNAYDQPAEDSQRAAGVFQLFGGVRQARAGDPARRMLSDDLNDG